MLILMRLMMKIVRVRKTVLASFFAGFVAVSTTIAFLLEPDNFETWFNAAYFVLTTMATVGYGDYSPQTTGGKLFTMFLYLFGIGLLSLIIGKMIDAIASVHRKREAGQIKVQASGHVIVINWSKKAQYAVEELLSTESSMEVVIIDEIAKHPMMEWSRVHFVQGDASSPEVLEQAGIRDARCAIVFADARIDDPSLVDGKSLLLASTIESTAPHVHTTVEIMLEKHIQNFKHVRVNEFVLSHDAVSRLAVRSALNEGSADLFTQLLSRQRGADLVEVAVRSEWRTYEDAFLALLRQGATLVSNRGDTSINERLGERIPDDAKLFAICSAETYRKLRA